MHDEAQIKAVIGALARYLRDNPHACDTADGIRRWWLPSDLDCTEDSLAMALDWMKRHQLIDITTAGDGRQRISRIGTGAELDPVRQPPAGNGTAD